MMAQARQHAGRAQGAIQTRAVNWDEEVELLARALPPDLARALNERIDPRELLEIVLNLGREPEARAPGRGALLAVNPGTTSHLATVATNVGRYADANQSGHDCTIQLATALR